MFANGLSSSPSNTPAPLRPRPLSGDHHPGQCPRPAPAAHRALRRQAASSSRSAARWAPSRPISGASPIPTSSSGSRPAAARRASARTATSSSTAPRRRSLADPAYEGGDYDTPPETGLTALGRVWAGWALSQQFYREELYRQMGFDNVEAFLVDFWEAFWLKLRRQRSAEPAAHLADRRHLGDARLRRRPRSARSAPSAPRPC